ncbi:DUF2298 domain-containing protein [Ferroglobus placidus]|uniref:DUF2298 domain-containing protein n=1 Tax=Ferroglobus placidus TaxID=54261 RepID=UPI00064F2A41|nr:DUF2298 domain-containing protein [Ferroglobus placidus]
MFEIVAFLLVVEIIGFSAYPLLRKEFGEEAYSLSKPFGLAILTAVALSFSLAGLNFFLSSLLALISLVILAVINRDGFYFEGETFKEELVFLISYSLSLLYLSLKPEIYFAYSEDFTDFAFLKSVLRFGILKDPWFGGEQIFYYFFGHALAASLIKLSRVKAEVGYNLAVAAYYSLAVTLSYSLGKRTTKKDIYGILSALFVCFAGFFSGFFQLVAFLFKTPILGYKVANTTLFQWLLNFDFSAATRVIDGAVVFYPFFTFLQGDMHAHFMSIPFQLAILLSSLSLYTSFSSKKFATTTFLFTFTLGINAWSFVLAFLLIPILLLKSKRFAILSVFLAVFITLLILTGILKFVESRTEFFDFLQVFALFLASTILYTAKKLDWKEFLLILFFIPLGLLLNFHLLFLFPLAFLLLREKSFENILLFAGTLTILFCELFYFDDPLGKPFERMNTVMKLYISAWIFWGVASAIHLSKLGRSALAVLAVFAFSLLHPVASLIAMPNSELLGNSGKVTLDGAEWLKEKHLEEYLAIKWLENKSGVVLEAPGEAYTYSSRVSTFTGLPTVIGWRTHEIMWGRSWEEVEERIKEVDEIYLNGSLELAKKYGVRYVFFGEVERIRYDKSELDYPWLKVVFKKGNVTIYEVP